MEFQLDIFEEFEKTKREQENKVKEDNINAVAHFHKGTSASNEDYCNKMLNVFLEEKDYYFDISDDDLLEDDDVVGHCMACGEPITKKDVAEVNALEYVWQHKNGNHFFAFCCFGKHSQEYTKKNPGSMGPGYYYDFHKKYLELCGLTEDEYREKLRVEQPTVYKARYGTDS